MMHIINDMSAHTNFQIQIIKERATEVAGHKKPEEPKNLSSSSPLINTRDVDLSPAWRALEACSTKWGRALYVDQKIGQHLFQSFFQKVVQPL